VKVVATQNGFYNQIFREPGEVFELLMHEDGSMPRARKWVPKLDANRKEIPDEGTWVDIKDKKGQPIHEHFAEDKGNVQITTGPKKGEVMHVGWMRTVPDKTPVGMYPADTDFWSGAQLPQCWVRNIGIQDPRKQTLIAHHAPKAADPDEAAA
jgi:hypothetical protein